MKIINHSISTISIITCLSLLVMLVYQIQTQAQGVKIKKPYTLVVSLMDGKKIKGILYKVNESSLELRTYPKSKKTTIAIDSQIVEVLKIKSIVIRKKDALGNGILIGAASGALVGFVVGKLLFPPEPYDPNGFNLDFSAAYVGISAGVGAAFGAFIGGAVAKGKTFKLTGDQAAFYQIKEKLKQFQVAPE